MPGTPELQAKIAELENALAKRKTAMERIAQMVNQLNNLLGVMRGHAQLAREDQNEEVRTEVIQVVLSSTAKAQQIIRSALTEVFPAEKGAEGAAEGAVQTAAKILVVEDEKLMTTPRYRTLKKNEHAVTVANSGPAAIECCKKQSFDLIFMDIMLGEMNGVDVLREIRHVQSASHVVFFSGDPSIKDVQKLVRQERVDGFIRKPFDINEINSVVSYILNMSSFQPGPAEKK
jgi:CheY-like chemotaxis protein